MAYLRWVAKAEWDLCKRKIIILRLEKDGNQNIVNLPAKSARQTTETKVNGGYYAVLAARTYR